MHPTIARFVPQSASTTMSSIASNLAALARTKLRSAYTGGTRDNLSLHRWVLLKNSITTQDVHSDLATQNAAFEVDAAESPNEIDTDLEDEEVDSSLDSVKFMFPDPGDDVVAPEVSEVSEEQWLDSLLETLGDEDSDDEDDARVSPVSIDDANAEQLKIHSLADPESFCTSLSEEFATPQSITVPYPVPYPPLEHASHDCCFVSDSIPYLPYHHHDIEDSEGSVPDAIEDTSDDESESISTPFSRSRASLSLVDPASIPLPRDQYEPHIYDGSNVFFPYEEDPLPDAHSDSTPVYSPYHQSC